MIREARTASGSLSGRMTQAIAALLLVSVASLGMAADRLELIAHHPHNSSIYTQGLAIDDGLMYQSSGLRGRSAVVAGKVGTAEVARHFRLPASYFGEGLAVVGDEVMVLTWQSETLLALDKRNLSLKRQLHYPGEGWGLTWDGSHLLLSDGSDRISWREPKTMASVRSVRVRDKRGPVRRLNELEWARGAIFANVWKTDRLIAIDPVSGRVVAEWDLTPLMPERRNFGAEGVANGIAYDQSSGHFWLTGKGWPLIYEVRLHTDALDKR